LRRAAGRREPGDVTDVSVVSCTGYGAPGLDILLARDLALPRDVRRVVIGHMGCHGALVGLRQALTAVRAQPKATVLLASVELVSLHFTPTLDPEVLTSYALFGMARPRPLSAPAPKGRATAGRRVLRRGLCRRGPDVMDHHGSGLRDGPLTACTGYAAP